MKKSTPTPKNQRKPRATSIKAPRKTRRTSIKAPRRTQRTQNTEDFKSPLRIVLIGIFTVIAFSYLLAKIQILKLTYGDEYERKAVEQLLLASSSYNTALSPKRGEILDRNDNVIVHSEIYYNMFLDVKKLTERAEKMREDEQEDTSAERQHIDVVQETLNIIHSIIGTPMEVLNDAMTHTDSMYYVFAKEVEQDKINQIEQLQEQYAVKSDDEYSWSAVLRDVYWESFSKRIYDDAAIAPQVIGFMREQESWGIEDRYNDILAGSIGRLFRSYAGGQFTTNRIPPVHGAQVVTTLDLSLQKFAESICEKYAAEYDSPNTLIIVMDPETGEIRAMAQAPKFSAEEPMNLNFINVDKVREDISAITDSSAQVTAMYNDVWSNFAISQTFEPGSIFKPITVAAALEEGIITPNDTFMCPGYKKFKFANEEWTIKCNRVTGHGLQTLEESISNSCNVALMDIAEKMGRDIFYKYEREFGFGEKTGIDLPREQSAATTLFSLANLNTLELATSSFGQRFEVTPIQMMTAFSALINGGYIYKPYVVSQTVEGGVVSQQNRAAVVRTVISKETSDYMREVMQSVLLAEGTGSAAAIDGYDIGGKTGTAEKGVNVESRGEVPYHLSFMGYLPVEKPEFLVLALAENVPFESYQSGTTSVAPMIKEVFQYIIDNNAIMPSDAYLAANSSSQTEVGNYVGMSLAQAIEDIYTRGLDVSFVTAAGSVITKQTPPSGTVVSKGAEVALVFE
ncbi:MAG: PASTA domain-containing protein, partial [Clostridiales bacterium]|nr:PASTA domain-containing protein [Clostridiales bacterium]